MSELTCQQNDIEETDRSEWESFRRELTEEMRDDTGGWEEDLEIMRYDWILNYL